MAVDYLKDYLGVDPSDYSAMEQGIAGISPVGRSIIPRMGGSRFRRQPIRPPMLSDLPGMPIRRIGRRLQPVQPEPTPDFGSQITGLEEQITNLMEQMQALESEKIDALNQQDIMRAELAQSQQDALAAQAEEFSGVKTNLEQQIADLTAQIGDMQAPVDVPPPPVDVPPPIDDMRDLPPVVPPRDIPPPRPPYIPPRDEQIFVPPKDIIDPRASKPRGEPVGRNVPGGGGIDYGPAKLGPLERPIAPPLPPVDSPPVRPPFEKPIIPPRREDFISIDRIPDRRDDFIPRMPNEDRVPFIPPSTPMPMPEPVIPMSPPQKTMSRPMMGGARGGLGMQVMRPMMMRASGGTISQAIADLQNRFK